jgi:hypothetical protein
MIAVHSNATLSKSFPHCEAVSELLVLGLESLDECSELRRGSKSQKAEALACL